MKIDLRILEEGVNALSWDETPEDLGLKELAQEFSGPIHTELNVVKISESLTASGSSAFSLTHECVRCLERFEESFRAQYQFIFQTGEPSSPDETEDDTIVWIEEEAGLFDLAEDVRDFIVLEIPMNPVCKEACKGLCTTCGINLNDESCGCTPQAADSRWDALRELGNS